MNSFPRTATSLLWALLRTSPPLVFGPVLGRVLVFAVALVLIAVSRPASAQTSALCTPRGYTVAFFNGVWSADTEDGALSNLNALRRLHGDTHRGEPVAYELFFNQTGARAGASAAQDLAEVFIQRADEVDASGELARRWEFFWDTAADGDRTLTQRLAEGAPSAALLLSGLYADLSTKAASGWSRLLSNPPTAVDSAAHRTRLDTLALEGQKLVLVAHSQGNLFANVAHDHIAARHPGAVATVHIAPASPTLRGNHLLADIDLVIHALRAQGLGTVPPVNLTLPFSRRDPSGHGFTGTYLDAARAGRGRVLDLLTAASARLTAPSASAARGTFTVTLTWDGAGDLDLHVAEPDGTRVNYTTPSGAAGELDRDNRFANGPEHYVATCDAGRLADGTYTVGLNHFGGATGRRATVQIASARDGEVLSRTVVIGPARGASGNVDPEPVAHVIVTRRADGAFDVAAR